ncbi:MAG TPA: 4-(cytidine 5'-diphospho)-2-C-methyl-D-erythritol kinase [Erysipelotrichaceae bacterium]|nr:4-(cytidine 5'-diphospho)-2-C-methyl-D-erythritol kinase [Erysipelotrichaceae bacterium]
MRKLHLRSYAKINLCLNIIGKRKDGYHVLDMIVLPISLHDSLIVSKLRTARDNLVTVDDYSNLSYEYNLAKLAIEKMQKIYGFKEKFGIFIHKVIPVRGGLGGGSSNAATTLKAINSILKLGADEEKLMEIGKTLGSDVPFFVKNVPARCQGIGEIITPITVKNNYFVLIVKPEAGCATKDMYQYIDTMNLPICNVDKVVEALADGDDDAIAENISNAFQSAAISVVPEIQDIIDTLHSYGLKIVQLTGSGSAVFAMSTDKKLLKKAFKGLEDKYQVELARVLK